jgi:hypothetical protein
MENTINLLSRRAGFNTALRHFKSTNTVASEVQNGENLADIINESLADGSIARYQVRAMLNALLVDKFGYAYSAHNMEQKVESAEKIVERAQNWGKLNIVMAYHHPQAGLFVINPANPAHWEESLPLIKDELVVVYVGSAYGDLNRDVLEGAVEDFIKLLYGRSIKDKDAYLGQRRRRATATASPQAAAEPKQEAPSPEERTDTAQPTGEVPSAGSKRRITPQYAVTVSNELFHNGNVEAWKKVIESYKTKYPDCDVLIWYENERINDINALFKWGKVKHGVPIMFSVVGENIKDVSKLQRYLYEGASPRFEVFLRGGMDRVLELF